MTFFTAPLRYSGNVAREKGVDIRIALDMVRMARLAEYDVALLLARITILERWPKKYGPLSKKSSVE